MDPFVAPQGKPLFPILEQNVAPATGPLFPSFAGDAQTPSFDEPSAAAFPVFASANFDVQTGGASSWLTNASFDPSKLTSGDHEQKGEQSRGTIKERRHKDGKNSQSRSRARSKSPRRSKKAKKHTSRKSEKRKRDRSESASSASSKEADKSRRHRRKDRSRSRERVTKTKSYTLDVKGDRHNLSYGGLYAADIVDYVRPWRDLCLGPSTVLYVRFGDHRGPRRDGEGGGAGAGTRYHAGVRGWSKEQHARGVRVRVRLDAKARTVGEFIAVEAPVLTEESLSTKTEGEIAQRNQEYSQYLREHPRDVDKWKEFAEYQIRSLAAGRRTKGSLRTMAERQLSIYERALHFNPANEELLLAYLGLGQQLWSYEQLLEEWRKVMFTHASSPAMWAAYLSMREGHFATYTFRGLLAQHERCVATLQGVRDGTFGSIRAVKGEQSDLDILRAIERACMAQYLAGHTERAVASLQALIEFNCYPPDPDAGGRHTVKAKEFFELFWDSETERFGEPGAAGWGAWSQAGSDNMTDHGKAEEPRDDHENAGLELTAREKWVYLESLRDDLDVLPFQRSHPDMDDPDDPDRIVLYDDVTGFIVPFEARESQLGCIVSLFNVLRSPWPVTRTSTASAAEYATLQDPSSLFAPLATSMSKLLAKRVREARLLDDTIVSTVMFSVPEPEALSYDVIYGWARRPQLHNQAVVMFIRQAFQQALAIFGDDEDTCLAYIEFERLHADVGDKTGKAAAAARCKEAGRITKEMLRNPMYRNNLRLWQAYAQLEAKRGKAADARIVYHSALALYCGQENVGSMPVAFLVRCYAEWEVSQGMTAYALEALTAYTEGGFDQERVNQGDRPVAARLLRARRAYADKLDQLLQGAASKVNQMHAPDAQWHHLVTCFGIFEYLGQGVEAMCAVFNTALQALVPASQPPSAMAHSLKASQPIIVGGAKLHESSHASLPLEHFLCGYIQLVGSHALAYGLPASLLRGILVYALRLFPGNPYFWSHYYVAEAKLSAAVYGSRLVDDLLSSCGDLAVPWMFAIENECLQLHPNSNRIRRFFERMTEKPHVQRCASLWHMYMRFEACVRPDCLPGAMTPPTRHDTSWKREERIKSVLYRALQHCPGIKSLYTEAVMLMDNDSREWDIVVDLIQEKELRLRTPIEELMI